MNSEAQDLAKDVVGQRTRIRELEKRVEIYKKALYKIVGQTVRDESDLREIAAKALDRVGGDHD